MALIENLLFGFSEILSFQYLVSILAGISIGTMVGMLPGIGSSTTMAILLPVMFGLEPLVGILLLCGIYFGANYSSAIVAVLLNIPGDAAAVMTTLDGHALAKKGKGSQAITIAALSSFVGATLSVIVLMAIAMPITEFALSFGPPEYFAILTMALVLLAMIGSDSFYRGLIAAGFGLVLGTVGAEPIQGFHRFTFGNINLIDGLSFIPVTMGLFAVSDVIINIEKGIKFQIEQRAKTTGLVSRKEIAMSAGAAGRGSLIGFITGVLPGAGATVASFIAYAFEKKISKNPREFGTGKFQGVAAPEAANSASAGGAMVPMLTLGIPGSKSTAMMLAGLTIMGVKPGPLLLQNDPRFFWGIISGLYVSNLLVLLLIMPLASIFIVRIVTRLRYVYLYPLILMFSMIGSYSLSNNVFDLFVLFLFGVLGYIMHKVDIPAAPVVIGLILGPKFEQSLLQSLIISRGDVGVFFERPISATILILTFILIVLTAVGPRILRAIRARNRVDQQ